MIFRVFGQIYIPSTDGELGAKKRQFHRFLTVVMVKKVERQCRRLKSSKEYHDFPRFWSNTPSIDGKLGRDEKGRFICAFLGEKTETNGGKR